MVQGSGVNLAGRSAGGKAGRALTPAEFAGLFERASRKLWGVAVAIVGDGQAAEDIVQEAAAIALGKLDQFDPSTSFGAWMAQIVRFVAMNERRRVHRQRTSPSDPAAMAHHADGRTPRGPTPVDRGGGLRAGQDAFDDAMTRALESLTEIARSCLLLRTVLDLPYAEIAELLGVPEGTAMSHVHRSRAAMRRLLGEPAEGATP